VWDTANCCTPAAAWPIGKNTRALALAKINGRELVAGAVGNQVYFWDIASGEVESLRLALKAEDPITRIQSLAVSADNAMLAAGSDDGNVTVWDLSTGAFKYSPLCTYGEPEINARDICRLSQRGFTEVRGIAFSPDGKWLAAGSSDQRVWLWEVATGDLVTRSSDGQRGGHINTVTSVVFNQAGDQLMTASWDNTVRVWDIQPEDAGVRILLNETLIGHSSSIWALALSPDDHWLASGSSDQTTILWKMDQVSQFGELVAQLDGAVWALATSPQRNQLAAGDEAGHIHIWDFDGESLSNPRTLQQAGAVYSVAYSQDGRWLASVGDDSDIHVWDMTNGAAEEAWTIPGAHTDEIWAVVFSPDDRWLASASFDGTVKLWDTMTHQLISSPFAEGATGFYALAFSPDGSQLVAAGFDRDIQKITLSETGAVEAITPFKGHDDAVNSLSFNATYPNFLVSTSDDKTLLIWNVATGEPTTPVWGLNESMEAVTFRPDGLGMASATNNHTVLLWQWDAERCTQNWVAKACQPAILGAPITGHKETVANVLFLSETSLISSSVNGELILWNLDDADWHARACAVVNRPLSEGEREQYINEKVEEGWLKFFAWKNQVFGGAATTPPDCLKTVQP
jgi:WD40 repeat protein